MTLHRRLRLASLALSVSLTLTLLLSVALLWWWASQWGALALMAAGIPAPPLSGSDLVPLCCYLAWFTLVAAAQGERYTTRLAGIAGNEQAMPLAQPEYAEGAPPVNLPVTLQWKTSRQLIELVAMILTIVAVLLGLLGVAAVAFAASMVASGQIAVVIFVGSVGAALMLFCAVVMILVNARLFHPPTHGVVADEQGIRQWTRRGEGPTLAWRDLRLLDVSGTPMEEEPRYGLLFRVYSTQGHEVSWVLVDTMEYLPGGATGADADAAARALVWLARTRGLLTPRTIYPQLASARDEAPVGELRQRMSTSLFRLFVSLLIAMLAVGALPFHGLLFPAFNIVSAAYLALFALALFGRSAWLWLGLQRHWIAAAERVTRESSPAPSRRALVEASLALVGGALGWIAVYSAPVVGGAPAWLLGDFLMLLGMPGVTVAGWVRARGAWRRLHGAKETGAQQA